jgi:hypothetical protein
MDNDALGAVVLDLLLMHARRSELEKNQGKMRMSPITAFACAIISARFASVIVVTREFGGGRGLRSIVAMLVASLLLIHRYHLGENGI